MQNLLTLLLVSIFVQWSYSQSKNFIDQPYLETTARFDTLVNPDLIYLNIQIKEKDENNRISSEQLEAKMIDALNELGIDIDKQLVLTDLASNYKKYVLKQKNVLKDKAYELKVYDSETASLVLMKLEESGISNVELSRTEYSQMEELKLILKSRAIEKAKMQAEFLVKPLNQRVTKALLITDKFYDDINNLYRLDEVVLTGYSGSKLKQEYEPPSIEFKPIFVESSVTVIFAID